MPDFSGFILQYFLECRRNFKIKDGHNNKIWFSKYKNLLQNPGTFWNKNSRIFGSEGPDLVLKCEKISNRTLLKNKLTKKEVATLLQIY